MAMSPDFDLWSKWKQLMNMSEEEIARCNAEDKEDIIFMMQNSGSWKNTLDTWGGTQWEKLRQMLRDNKTGQSITGHIKSKALCDKPDRTQLMFGTIESYDGFSLLGFELSDDGTEKSADELFAEEMFKEEEEPPEDNEE